MVVRLSALRTGRIYPQEMLLVLISVRGWVDPQSHSAIGKISWQWKIPMTPDGIQPATFRFVAQHLNHCATAVPTVEVLWFNILVFTPLAIFFQVLAQQFYTFSVSSSFLLTWILFCHIRRSLWSKKRTSDVETASTLPSICLVTATKQSFGFWCFAGPASQYNLSIWPT